MEQHSEEDTIFTLSTTLRQAPALTLTLDTTTVRHLATAMDPPSHNHSWQVLTTSALMKSKFFTKLPEGITELGVLVLHTLLTKMKLSHVYYSV